MKKAYQTTDYINKPAWDSLSVFLSPSPTLSDSPWFMLSQTKRVKTINGTNAELPIRFTVIRGAWVAQSLKHWLWFRSWSHSLWVWALRQALCWQFRDESALDFVSPLSLPCSRSVSLKKKKHLKIFDSLWSSCKMNTLMIQITIKKCTLGSVWVAQLSGWLWLKSWSYGSRVGALCQALCWQCTATLDSLSPSLPLPRSHSLSKIIFKKKCILTLHVLQCGFARKGCWVFFKCCGPLLLIEDRLSLTLHVWLMKYKWNTWCSG